MKTLVSIIINNYNYGRFLDKAIRSALAQTYKPIEVIVVDDGSTDDSRSIIDTFTDQIKPVLKLNGGQGSTYNAGFSEAHGDLILYLDSDDLLEDRAIETAVDAWEPGIAKVHFYLRVGEGQEPSPTNVVIPTSKLAEGDLRSQLLSTGNYTTPPASGNLYARNALEQIFPMPEANWAVSADTYPIFLTPFFGRVRACNKVLGVYRVHGKNQDAQTLVSGDLLRYRLRKESSRDAMFVEFCNRRMITYLPGSVTNEVAHMKIRLASLILEPMLHPHSDDRKAALAWRTLKLCWGSPNSALFKRLLITLWTLALLGAPRRCLSKLVELAFVPIKRPRILNRLINA